MEKLRISEVNNEITIYSNNKNNSNSIRIERGDVEIIVDTFLFPKSNKLLFDELNKHTPKKHRYIINTHSHSDHCYGNLTLKTDNSTLICHALYKETFLSEKRMIKAGKTYEKMETRLPQPDITFNDRLSLNQLELELIHTPGHTLDSISVYSPDDKVLITGDNTLSSYKDYFILPFFYWGSIVAYLKSLEILSAYPIDTIIPGHGAPINKEKIEEDTIYLTNLQNIFTNAITDFKTSTHFFDDNTKFNEQNIKEFVVNRVALPDCLPKSKKVEKIGLKEIHILNVKKLILDHYKI